MSPTHLVPEINHVQYAALTNLIEGPATASTIRRNLSEELGWERTPQAFSLMMRKLHERDLVDVTHEQRMNGAYSETHAVYELRPSGRSAIDELRSFYMEQDEASPRTRDRRREAKRIVTGNLHPAFEALVTELPFCELRDHDLDQARLLERAYQKSVRHLNEQRKSSHTLVRSILTAAVEDRTTSGAVDVSEVVGENLHTLIGASILTKPEPIRIQGDAKSRCAPYVRSLHEITRHVVEELEWLLDRLQEQGIIGSLLWHGPEVFDFNYGRFVIDEEDHQAPLHKRSMRTEERTSLLFTTRRYIEKTTTKRHLKVHFTLQRHDRRLHEPAVSSLPAAHVPKPVRIRPVVDAVPSWLDGISRIVTSKQYEAMVSTEVTTTKLRTIESASESVVGSEIIDLSPAARSVVDGTVATMKGVTGLAGAAGVAALGGAAIAGRVLLDVTAHVGDIDPAIAIANKWIIAGWYPDEQ